MISLIVAISKNGAIGRNNELLFHIKEDLNFFKKTTMSKTIIMGRKTFESLPSVLPGRKHVVITRDLNYEVKHNQVEVVNSIDSILEKYKDSKEEVFIIGGGQIYAQALRSGLVDMLYVTIVDEFVDDADTFFPEIDTGLYSISKEIQLVENAKVLVYKKI